MNFKNFSLHLINKHNYVDSVFKDELFDGSMNFILSYFDLVIQEEVDDFLLLQSFNIK